MPRLSFAVVAAVFGVPSLLGSPPVASCPAWTATGERSGARFGSALASAGDVDGDGFVDLIVGAPSHGVGGRACVFAGTAFGLSLVPAWAVEGAEAQAQFAASVSTAGDVNGDGYDDVVVGAPYYDGDLAFEGRASLFLGGPAGLATLPAWTVEGDQAIAVFGAAVSTAGDVNGDGYGDVIVGAPNYDHGEADEGRACLYLGSAAGLATSPAWTAESDQAGFYPVQFGAALASAGDVNGDGFGDVIVGARGYSVVGGQFEGRAYVYHGSPAGLSASPAWTKVGASAGVFFGKHVASAGDVNGDGFDDVIVGANSAVGVYVYLGSSTGLASSAAWTAHAASPAASAGDVNGDGYDDVIVNVYSLGGRTQIYLGSATGLAQDPIWSAENEQAGAGFGSAVASLGDVNLDGYDDVVIGAPDFNSVSGQEGRADLYLGSAGFLSSSVFPGDGLNRDVIEPVNAVTGSSWSAPVRLDHFHGNSGPLVLSVRTTTTVGAGFASPVGGRLTQTLIAGPLLARITGSHDRVSGDIPPQVIPAQALLVGLPWAAQYAVIGGGHVDLSQAVFGVFDSCP